MEIIRQTSLLYCLLSFVQFAFGKNHIQNLTLDASTVCNSEVSTPICGINFVLAVNTLESVQTTICLAAY